MELSRARVVLALSPHPDDVELCAGGTVAWLTEAGAKVYVAQVSDVGCFGVPSLASECARALEALGVHDVCTVAGGTLQRRTFQERRQELLDGLISLRRGIKPDAVLAPCSDDTHQDHAAVHAEALRAFRGTTLLGYEAPWSMRRGSATVLVRLAQRHVDRKSAALRCYASQHGRAYFGAAYQEALLRTRGLQAGVEFAEAFESLAIFTGSTP